ncbi:MAG: NAD-dependent epimerase/dehydratase family protein [Zavarzinella sp.]
MKRVLVTGGGGFLGKAIIRQLLPLGCDVRSYSRGSYPELTAIGVEHFSGDLTDHSTLLTAMQGCDTVFHVAAKAGIWGSKKSYYQTNFVGTQQVFQAAQKASVGKFIFTSSPSVSFSGTNQDGVSETTEYPKKYLAWYPWSKALAEQYVLEHNCMAMPTVALRPHLIWGPGDPHLIPSLISKAKKGKLRQIGKIDCLVDTTYVDNAAMAHIRAAEKLSFAAPHSGKAYYISQNQPEPLWQFINKVLKLAAIPPVTRTVPVWLAYSAGTVFELIYGMIGRKSEPPMTRFVARQLSTSHWFRLENAMNDFGYSPTITTEVGLVRLQQWFHESTPTD